MKFFSEYFRIFAPKKMGKVVHNNSISIAKAIGIILMVIGHSGCPLLLYKSIYLFHMPLFFFCSGLFFKGITTKRTAFLFLKKKFKYLYVPFVRWSLLFLVFHNILMSVGIYNTNYGYNGGSSYYSIEEMMRKLFLILFTMRDYEELLGGFWFIRTLFISSILIAIFSFVLRNLEKKKHIIMCIIFISFAVIIRRFAPDSEIWRDISMSCLGAFFYIFGNHFILYVHYCQNKYGAIICCISLMVSFHYFKDGISMDCGYNKIPFFSVSALSGTLLTLYISDVIEKKLPTIKPVLYSIGNQTMTILALHMLCFRFCSFLLIIMYGVNPIHLAEHPVIKDVVGINNTWWWWLYSITGVFLPLMVNKILYVIVLFINRLWRKFQNKFIFP